MPGVGYRVWRAEGVSGPWTAVGGVLTGDGTPVQWSDPAPPVPGSRVYYRLEVP